jgi:hypothetical protein
MLYVLTFGFVFLSNSFQLCIFSGFTTNHDKDDWTRSQLMMKIQRWLL